MRNISDLRTLIDNLLNAFNSHIRDRKEIIEITDFNIESIEIRFKNRKKGNISNIDLPICFKYCFKQAIINNIKTLMSEALSIEQDQFDKIKKELDEYAIEVVKSTSTNTETLDEVKENLKCQQ